MKKGLTLLELLITIIILGVLVSIAVPNYTRMVEKAKADQAATYLRAIRTGEKIYYSNNASYTACANAADINLRLNAEVTEESYIFTVTSDTANTFLATAQRRADNTTVTLDQDGVWDGTSPYRPH